MQSDYQLKWERKFIIDLPSVDLPSKSHYYFIMQALLSDMDERVRMDEDGFSHIVTNSCFC